MEIESLDLKYFDPIAPEALDSSMISTWLSCPRKFYLEYVLGLRPKNEDRVALTYGSLWHKVLETAWRDSIEAALNLIEDNYDVFKLNDDKNRTAKRMRADFIRYLKEYAKVDGSNKILALEKPFDLLLPNGIRYCGKIDRVFETGKSDGSKIKIMDHKSTTFFTSTYFDNLELGIQVPGYLYALRRLSGNTAIREAVIDVYHILKNKTNFVRRTLSFRASKLAAWERNICRITEEITEGLENHLEDPEWWYLNPGQRCSDYGGCAFKLVHQLPPERNNRTRLLAHEFKVVRWDPINHEEES